MRTLLALLAALLCGNNMAFGQLAIPAYTASVPVTGWTVDAQGEPTIGTVTVPLLLVKSVPNGASYPAYSGGNNNPQEFTRYGAPVKSSAFAMTLYERPIAYGSVMTIVEGNARVSVPRGEGSYNATYQTTPPLSGNITVNLTSTVMMSAFPSSVSLTYTTTSYVP